MDGIKGIPRRNTDDFWILFIAPTITEKSVLSNIDLHENETFLDVGANVGNYTLRVAHKYQYKEVRIISIEAHPETYRALCRNIDCNNFKNVKTICKAVTDHKGSVTMYDQIDIKSGKLRYHFRLSSAFKRVIQKPRINLLNLRGTGSYEIDCDTLDNIIGGHNVDVMKMDIEGSEIPALAGANDTLKRLRKVIVEVHASDDLQGVKKLLEDNDFKLKLEAAADFPKHIIGSKD